MESDYPVQRLSDPPYKDHDDLCAPQPTLSELFATSALDASVTGFACAQLSSLAKDPRPVVWIQDRVTRLDAGRPCLSALPRGMKLLYVRANRAVDVLWAMEESLYSHGIAAVIGEVWGDPPALDFTATKRIALRSEARAIPALLLRRAATPNLSAARLRWRIGALPALSDPYDSRAPGQAQWQADLFRARGRAPGAWVAQDGPQGLELTHPSEPGRLRRVSA